MSNDAKCDMSCTVVEDGRGTFACVIVVADLTKEEAKALGNMLHGPVRKYTLLALKDRVTAETYSTSSIGSA